VFLDPDFLEDAKNFGDSHIFKADIGSLIFAQIFRTSWPKMGVLGCRKKARMVPKW